MTAQVKTLAAPVLKEAENGVLHVGKLKEHATAVVPPYVNSAAGDKVALHVKTSTGNNFEVHTTVTTVGAGKPILFAIPKHIFEKDLVTGATAKLHYVVTAVAHDPAESAPLTVRLER